MFIKNRIFIVFVLSLQLLCFRVDAVNNENISDSSIVLHVSPNGSDYNIGSEERPFATFDKARDAVRKLISTGNDITVLFHSGTYPLKDTIRFSKSDSGQEGQTITYKAAGDGEVRFYGSREIDISAFRPIEDPETIARLVPGAEKQIGWIDLSQFGFTSSMVDFVGNTRKYVYDYPKILGVYLNGNRETLARFPNVGYKKIVNVLYQGSQFNNAGWDKQYNGDIIEIDVPNIVRWGMAKDMALEGYMGVDYSKEWREVGSLDTNKRTVKFAKWAWYPAKKDGRYTAINLLEELDIPGEWYIDKEKKILYYYPSHTLQSGKDKLTISVLNNEFINIDGANNLHFEGLKFTENQGSGIIINNTKNIIVKNCVLSNIGYQGINLTKSSDALITGCTIYYTGARGVGIEASCGDRQTLTHCNIEVSNNHFYCTGRDSGSNTDGGILTGATGAIIKNNLFHNIENYPIAFFGCENEISYNEIYNNIRNTADAAVIYTGASLVNYGNRIEYNYLHDNVMFNLKSSYGSHGIAFDDWSSGSSVEHNIVKMGRNTGVVGGIGSHGRDTVIRYNTVINSGSGSGVGERDVPNVFSTEGFWAPTLKRVFNSLNTVDTTVEPWISRYPTVSKVIDVIKADGNRFRPRDNVVTDNVNVDVKKVGTKPELSQYSTVERNVWFEDYSIFVDPDNHDYRIKKEAMEKLGLSQEILNENNFKMGQIGLQTDQHTIEKLSYEFAKVYPKNGQTDIQRNESIIAWEKPLFSDEYYYVVATDPELKNVVAEGKTVDNKVIIENLKNGQSYYWDVKAKNISMISPNEWGSIGKPYLFTIAEYDNIDKSLLVDKIAQAKEIQATIKMAENPQIGEFKPEIIDSFKQEIQKAESASAKTFTTQEAINEAYYNLISFLNGIGGYKYSGYKNIQFEDEQAWKYNENADKLSVENGVMTNTSTQGFRPILSLKEKVSNNEMLYFQMKMQEVVGWSMFSLRNQDASVMPYATDSYSFVVKPDVIELQKRAKILQSYPNNGTIKSDTWQNYQFGVIDVRGGVEITLKIDGIDIFNYLDKDTPIYKQGSFVLAPMNDITISVKPVQSVPNGLYEPDLSKYQEKAKSFILDTKSTEYSEKGNFIQTAGQGYDGDVIKISDGLESQVSWVKEFKMKNYKISYWHVPLEGGDKNAKIRFITGGGIDGESSYEKAIDFSKGNAGWIEMGTFANVGFNGIDGNIRIEIVASGTGKIPISAIKIEDSTQAAGEFTKVFYENNKNLLLLKVANTNAYYNATALSSLDSFPFILNGRTMLPLRFIAEAFRGAVSWNEEQQKATVLISDKTIEFTLNQNGYTLNDTEMQIDQAPILQNGRVMIPVRAVSEALGKQIYWDEGNQMIFIGDVLKISEQDIAACIKMFVEQ